MSAINGLTLFLLATNILMWLHYKGKIEELKKDIKSWQQGYSEVNTKLHKAEKIIRRYEKK